LAGDVNVTLYTVLGLMALVGLCVALFAALLIIALKKRAAGYLLNPFDCRDEQVIKVI